MTEIRRARPEDIPTIAAFTERTFEWGDYVADLLPEWLDASDGAVFVAVDDQDVPIAMARGTLLSPTEAWFHAARVHPDHRGRGIAGELAQVLTAWASDRGAEVGRLLIEDWNEASHRQVAKTGMRPVARFHRADRAVGEASVRPEGNGGKRIARPVRTRLARSAEAPAAFASWSVGPLARRARNLFARGWSFRRLRDHDLVQAAKEETFWEIGSGWAIVRPSGASIEAGWVETRPDEALGFLWGLVDLATETGREEIVVWLPDERWLTRAARQAGFETRGMQVYAIEL